MGSRFEASTHSRNRQLPVPFFPQNAESKNHWFHAANPKTANN
jgi:hypothetical protein